jgi:tetratricopeptide (TPR) repeat protein
MDYTAIGETTNLAARMESLAPKGTVLISESTRELVGDFFELKSLGPLKIKGKDKPQAAYTLLRPSEVRSRLDSSVRRGLTRFVGREDAIAFLERHFFKAKAGDGQMVEIIGEAGVGKSRLVLELKRCLLNEEFTYLEGRCLQYGESMSYLPILDILKTYFGYKDGEPESSLSAKINQKLQTLNERLNKNTGVFQYLLSCKVDEPGFSTLAPQEIRDRIFESLRDLFMLESQRKPLILVVEDLHWMDRTSEEFLSYFIESLAGTSIMLLLLARPEYSHRWSNASYCSRLSLDKLDAASSGILLESLLRQGQIIPEIEQLIMSRTSGNPFFMEELTRTLLENGSIFKKGSRYLLNKDVLHAEVPTTIQGIIAARIDRLEDDLKRTMQVAAVIGKDFVYRILQRITDIGEDLKDNLRSLQGLELIYQKRLFPELEFVFKHALTQEVAYNSLLEQRRKEIHARIGAAIEELYSERLEEFYGILAYHFSRSEDHRRAYKYLELSAKKAMGCYSHTEAYDLFTKAIQKLESLPDSVENRREGIALRLSMANPMTVLGFPEKSLEILQQVEQLSSEIGDVKSLAEIGNYFGFYHTLRGSPLRGTEYTERGLRVAEKIKDVGLIAPNAMSLCTAYNIAGEYRRVVEIALPVITLIEQSNREEDNFGIFVNPYSFLCAEYGNSMGVLGDFDEGEAYCTKGLRAAAARKDPISMGLCELNLGLLFVAKGSGEEVVEHFQKSIEFFEETHWTFLLGVAWAGLGVGNLFSGKPELAKEQVEFAFEVQKKSGVEALKSLQSFYLGMIHYEMGDAENLCCLPRKRSSSPRETMKKAWRGFLHYGLGERSACFIPQKKTAPRHEYFRVLKFCRSLDSNPICR